VRFDHIRLTDFSPNEAPSDKPDSNSLLCSPHNELAKKCKIIVRMSPPGYRDWKSISVSHEAGNLNRIGAILGNDVAIKAYREGKLPFPDGTIIAALHYRHTASEENNKVFGQAQSFKVRGATQRGSSITGKLEAVVRRPCPQPVVAQRHSVAKIGAPQNV
jgi:hypothetical protein